MKMQWVRGSSKVQSKQKFVQSKRVYFQEKFNMKTGIQFDKETLQPLTKPTTFRLMQVYSETEESFAGEL